jgi:hypothetical protein
MLHFPDMHGRIATVASPHTDTCRWIHHDSIFQRWARDQRGLLWIKGKGGSGNSVLVKYMLESFWNDDQKRCILHFFFHGRGGELLKTKEGLFRSLLHQFLTNLPDTFDSFLTHVTESHIDTLLNPKVGVPQRKMEESLGKLFSDLTLYAATEKRETILIVIDALDEAGHDSAWETAEYLHQLNDEALAKDLAISICLASRHYPVVSDNASSEIVMEKHNQSDVEKLVDGQIQQHLIRMRTGFPSCTMESHRWEEIQSYIINKSQGMFQWVHLMLIMVRKYDMKGYPLRTIQSKLKEVPLDLLEAYDYIVDMVMEEEDRTMSGALFRWILLSATPLRLKELQYAITMGDAQRGSSLHELNIVENEQRMHRLITSLSGGLVEVVASDLVQFIHETVHQYVKEKGFFRFNLDPITNSSLHTVGTKLFGEAHLSLARSCISMLVCPEFLPLLFGPRDPAFTMSNNRAACDFHGYSLRFWIHHVKQAELLGISSRCILKEWVDHLGEDFDLEISVGVESMRADSFFFKNVRLDWLGPPYAELIVTVEMRTLYHIACEHGLIGLTKELVSQMKFSPDSRAASRAIRLAMRYGRVDTVKALLRAGLWDRAPLSHVPPAGTTDFWERQILWSVLKKDYEILRALELSEVLIAKICQAMSRKGADYIIGHDLLGICSEKLGNGTVAAIAMILERQQQSIMDSEANLPSHSGTEPSEIRGGRTACGLSAESSEPGRLVISADHCFRPLPCKGMTAHLYFSTRPFDPVLLKTNFLSVALENLYSLIFIDRVRYYMPC